MQRVCNWRELADWLIFITPLITVFVFASVHFTDMLKLKKVDDVMISVLYITEINDTQGIKGTDVHATGNWLWYALNPIFSDVIQWRFTWKL